ncbi:hypothetical protein EDI_129480 [Entamoeba dispar SAW760]|uniref:Uncharacterized protein n=1 Tax=Entamoeba dispar (strain ATCC PRA-260 / SAW760) TaxID=370354 RepID=B0ETL0_ENTDS|nr:uncharacterized protein EDI_129480 [Entamoeba dispar SAW760]EDR22195.1 hypothetical protein EDI_129480 [Entamoeba dispar SAW760]|eukprot:EDR22195.1 hypothetical protein EDI_129480 [Entamoeba dispar SAW760]
MSHSNQTFDKLDEENWDDDFEINDKVNEMKIRSSDNTNGECWDDDFGEIKTGEKMITSIQKETTTNTTKNFEIKTIQTKDNDDWGDDFVIPEEGESKTKISVKPLNNFLQKKTNEYSKVGNNENWDDDFGNAKNENSDEGFYGLQELAKEEKKSSRKKLNGKRRSILIDKEKKDGKKIKIPTLKTKGKDKEDSCNEGFDIIVSPRKKINEKKPSALVGEDNWDDIFINDKKEKKITPRKKRSTSEKPLIKKSDTPENWDNDFADELDGNNKDEWGDNFGEIPIDEKKPIEVKKISVTTDEVWDDDFSLGENESFQSISIPNTTLIMMKLPFLKQVKDLVDHFPEVTLSFYKEEEFDGYTDLCIENIDNPIVKEIVKRWEKANEYGMKHDYINAEKLYLPLINECLKPTLPVSDLFKLRVFYQAYIIYKKVGDKSKCNQMLELAYTMYSTILDPPNDACFSRLSARLNCDVYELNKDDDSFTPKVNRLIEALSCYLYPLHPFTKPPQYIYPWKIIGELSAILSYELEYFECTCEGITDILFTKVQKISLMFGSIKTTEFMNKYIELHNKHEKEKEKKNSKEEQVIEEEEDWDAEFGITPQTNVPTLSVFDSFQEEIMEENPPENCRLLEIINNQSVQTVGYGLPMKFYDERLTTKFQAPQLQQYIEETTKEIKENTLWNIIDLPVDEKLSDNLIEILQKKKDIKTLVNIAFKSSSYSLKKKVGQFNNMAIGFVRSELLRQYDLKSINIIEMLQIICVCYSFGDEYLKEIGNKFFTGCGFQLLEIIRKGYQFHIRMNKGVVGNWRDDEYFEQIDSELDNLKEKNDDELTIIYNSWILCEAILIELGYSSVTYTKITVDDQLLDVDKKFLNEQKSRLVEYYKKMEINFFKARVALVLGIIFNFFEDSKTSESLLFDSFYILRQLWYISLFLTPLGIKVCIKLLQVSTLNHKTEYCKSLIDTVFFVAPYVLYIDIQMTVKIIADIATHIGEETKAINMYKWLIEIYYKEEKYNEFLYIVGVLAEIYISIGLYDSAFQLLALRFVSQKHLETTNIKSLPIYHQNMQRLAEIFLHVGDDKRVQTTINFFNKLNIPRSKEVELKVILAKMYAKRGWCDDCLKTLEDVHLFEFELINKKQRTEVAVNVFSIIAMCYVNAEQYHRAMSMIDFSLTLCDNTDYRLLGSLFFKRGNVLRKILSNPVQTYPSYLRDDDGINKFLTSFLSDENGEKVPIKVIEPTLFNGDWEVVQEALLSFQKSYDIYTLLADDGRLAKTQLVIASTKTQFLLRTPNDSAGYCFASTLNLTYFEGSSFLKKWSVVKIKTSVSPKDFIIDAEGARKYAYEALKTYSQMFDIWHIIPAYVTMAEIQFLRDKRQESYSHLQLAVQTLYTMFFDGPRDIGPNIPAHYVFTMYEILGRVVRLMILFGKNTINANFVIIDTYLMLQYATLRIRRRNNEFIDFWENLNQTRSFCDTVNKKLQLDCIDETDLLRVLLIKMCNRINPTLAMYEAYATHALSLYSQLLYSKIVAIKYNVERYSNSRITKNGLIDSNKELIKNILEMVKESHFIYSFVIPQLGTVRQPEPSFEILPIFRQQTTTTTQTIAASTAQFKSEHVFLILQLCGSIIFYHSSGETCVCQFGVLSPIQTTVTMIAMKITIKKGSIYYIVSPTITISQLLLALSHDMENESKIKKSTFGSLKISKGKCKMVGCEKEFNKEIIRMMKQKKGFNFINALCLSRTNKPTEMLNEESTILSLLNPNQLKETQFNGHLKEYPQKPFTLFLIKRPAIVNLQNIVKRQTITMDGFLMNYFAYNIDRTRPQPCDSISQVKDKMEEIFNSLDLFKERRANKLIVSPTLNIIPWELLEPFKNCVRYFSFSGVERINSSKISSEAPPLFLFFKCSDNIALDEARKQELIKESNLALCYTDGIPNRSTQTIASGFFANSAMKTFSNTYPSIFKTIDIYPQRLFSEQLKEFIMDENYEYIVVISEADLLECSDLLSFIATQTNFGIMSISKLKYRKLQESTLKMEKKEILSDKQKFVLIKQVQSDLTGKTFNCSSLFHVKQTD